MSKSSHRFNLVYQAVVVTSLGVGTLSAQAVSLSQANIQSAQHEPLSATIDVNNIDAKNFDASVASGNVYQQMGLKQDADIQVKFTPTSDNSGKITLTSKAPISKPFTDVVLNLKNNGEEVVEPQTLLMPISNANSTTIPASLTEPIMVASEQEQNLPIAGGDIGATDTAINMPAPSNTPNNATNGNANEEIVALDLSAGEPIDLSPLDEANLQNTKLPTEANLAVQSLDNTQSATQANAAQAPIATPASSPSVALSLDDPSVTTTNDADDMNADASTTTSSPTQTNQALSTPKIISQQEQVLSAITPEGSNQQINILTEQITRKVLDSQEAIDAAAEPLPFPTTNEPTLQAKTPTAKDAKTTTNQNTAQNKGKGKKDAKNNTVPTETQSGENPTYVVQSGDSLWGIANQIAQANNVSVMEVMTSIHQQNPDAFFGNNINRLKTNAALNLPNYNVVPSQKAIQEAINTNRQTRGGQDGKTSTANDKATDKKAQAPKRSNEPRRATQQAQTAQARSNKPQARPLPKAQMTLVSPSNTGQATGTQEKGSNRGRGDGNNQLVNTLKNTRSQAAANATRVNSLNQELTSATQKLQLQNQKLAELEARLKALKDK